METEYAIPAPAEGGPDGGDTRRHLLLLLLLVQLLLKRRFTKRRQACQQVVTDWKVRAPFDPRLLATAEMDEVSARTGVLRCNHHWNDRPFPESADGCTGGVQSWSDELLPCSALAGRSGGVSCLVSPHGVVTGRAGHVQVSLVAGATQGDRGRRFCVCWKCWEIRRERLYECRGAGIWCRAARLTLDRREVDAE
jgi:hypothetical protein